MINPALTRMTEIRDQWICEESLSACTLQHGGARLGTFSLSSLKVAASHIGAAVVSPSLSPPPSLLLFLSLTVTRHLSRHFSWMEICSSSLQTGRLCEWMQSLGDGLSGSVYWHALIWHWVKGMSHRLQTHYHITATPANREAAPRIQVELHQCSLIQLPRATRSNKPCLLCVLAGWRGDGAFQRACVQVLRSATHTHTQMRILSPRTSSRLTHTHIHTSIHTHTYSIQTCTSDTGSWKKSSRPLNPQPPPNTISVHTSC